MIDTSIELKVGKLAEQAVQSAVGDESLSNAIAKIAQDEQLNQYEIKEICARANHIKNAALVKANRLETFDIAIYEKVAGIMSVSKEQIEKESSEEDSVLCVYDFDRDETFEYPLHKKAEDRAAYLRENQMMPDEQEMPQPFAAQPTEDVEMTHEQERNDLLGKMQHVDNESVGVEEAVTQNMDAIKDISRQLIQGGETFEEVVAILKSTLLREIPQLQNFLIADIASGLVSEGLITEEEAANIAEIEPYDQAPAEETPITKESRELVENIVKMAMLAEVEAELVEETTTKLGHNMVLGSISGRHDMATRNFLEMHRLEKNAAGGAFQYVSNATAPITSGGGLRGLGAMREGYGGYLAPAILGSTIFYGITRGLDAAAEAIKEKKLSTKAAVLKRELPQRYPYLQTMDPVLYSDLFDTLVSVTPELVKAPYALYQLIKGQSELQAIDPRVLHTIGGIDIGKRRGESSQSTLEGINSAMSAVVSPQLMGIKYESLSK